MGRVKGTPAPKLSRVARIKDRYSKLHDKEYEAARETINKSIRIKTEYSRLRSKLLRAFPEYTIAGEIPPASPYYTAIQAASASAIETMFENFRVGEFVGNEAVILICAKCSAQPEKYPELSKVFRAFADISDSLPKGEMICLPALIVAAGVDAAIFAGKLVEATVTFGQDAARLRITQAIPELIEDIISSSALPGREGHADKRLLLELIGMITKEKDTASPTININNSTTAIAGAAQTAMPVWGDSMKRVEAALTANPRTAEAIQPANPPPWELPAPSLENSVPVSPIPGSPIDLSTPFEITFNEEVLYDYADVPTPTTQASPPPRDYPLPEALPDSSG